MRSRLKERLQQSPSIGARSSHRSNASADRSYPRFQIRQKGLVVQSLTTPTPPSCHDPAIPRPATNARGPAGFRGRSPFRGAGSRLEAVGPFSANIVNGPNRYRASLRQKVARVPAGRQTAGPACPEATGSHSPRHTQALFTIAGAKRPPLTPMNRYLGLAEPERVWGLTCTAYSPA
jgi:hypothetical protein